MSFLFPLYLLGALALVIPVLLHLKKRPPKEQVEFSSLLFLEKSPEKTTRRSQLERLLLLLLRCLALLLLALGFGRPFLDSIRSEKATKSLTRAVILVDGSASMRRAGLWEAATQAAKDAAKRYPEGAEVALARFDESTAVLVDFSEAATLAPSARAARVEAVLSDEIAKPSWLGTELGKAMHRAADLLLAADAVQEADRRELVVISDFQSGAQRRSLQENPWPQEIRVRSVPVAPTEPGNVSLTLAAAPPRSRINEAETYRVRIANSADSSDLKTVLSWKGFPETATELLVAPGTSRIVLSPPRPEGATRGILQVKGDAHPFDNEVYLAPVQARPLRIFFVGKADEEKPGEPLFYLRRALHPTPTLEPMIRVSDSLADLSTESSEIALATSPWSVADGRALRAFAEAGGLVIATLSAGTTQEAFDGLVGRTDWQLREANSDSSDPSSSSSPSATPDPSTAQHFSLLADLDFEHPVLAPFARAQIRDFSKIRFWKHRHLDLGDSPSDGVHVLARYDDKAPAWVELRFGQGSIFLMLSGWTPDESQLALSSKFVPLLYSLFDHAGYSIRSAPTLYVGETEHAAPGFYEQPSDDGAPQLVSVNLSPNEGLTDPFDPAIEFSALGIPMAEANSLMTAAAEEGKTSAFLEAEQKESRLKLWKWLVFAALFLLLCETWIASRRRGGPGFSSAPHAPVSGGGKTPEVT